MDKGSVLNSKVLVGVPTYPGHDFCREEFVSRLREISAPENTLVIWNGINPKGFDGFDVVDYTPPESYRNIDMLCAKQNMMRERALKEGYDYLLVLESDIIPPKDVIPRLLKYRKDLLAAMYFIRGKQEIVFDIRHFEYIQAKAKEAGIDNLAMAHYVREAAIPAFWGLHRSSIAGLECPKLHYRLWTLEDWINGINNGQGLIPIMAAGMGCTLISRKLLERVPFINDKEFSKIIGKEMKQLTDFIFFERARAAGFDAFVDPMLICQHYHIEFQDESIREVWFDIKTLKPVDEKLRFDSP